MTSLKLRAGRIVRGAAERMPFVSGVVRKLATRPDVVSGPGYVQRTGGRYTVVSSTDDPLSAMVGIYLRGGCDLPALFSLAEILRRDLKGTVCIARDPNQIAAARSDFLLERLDSFDEPAQDAMQEVVTRLGLADSYFSADLFAPSFTLEQLNRRTFPKTVVVLSNGPDFTRSLYRHRQHGFLVDPGGFWLEGAMGEALKDPGTVAWFQKSFRRVGRLKLNEFEQSFARLVREIQQRAGARLLVFNMLTINPGERQHSYRLMAEPDVIRRREFNVALAGMAATGDFDVVDVDRVLKLTSVRDQVDFAHFREDQFLPVAEDAYRLLKARNLV